MSSNTFGATMTEIVDICLEDETTPKRRLRTQTKTYFIHPTTNPFQAVAPYNPNRYKTMIVAVDVSIVITMDLPTVTPDPTTGSLAPNGTSVVCGTTGNGFDGYDIYGPDPLWIVAILGNGNCRVDVVQTFWEADDS